jgi:hypothetical protein
VCRFYLFSLFLTALLTFINSLQADRGFAAGAVFVLG